MIVPPLERPFQAVMPNAPRANVSFDVGVGCRLGSGARGVLDCRHGQPPRPTLPSRFPWLSVPNGGDPGAGL